MSSHWARILVDWLFWATGLGESASRQPDTDQTDDIDWGGCLVDLNVYTVRTSSPRVRSPNSHNHNQDLDVNGTEAKFGVKVVRDDRMIKLDHLPLAVLREVLTISDLVRLSMTNRTMRAWCEDALRSKRRLVDEPIIPSRLLFDQHNDGFSGSRNSVEFLQWTSKSKATLNDTVVFNTLTSLSSLKALILSDLDAVTDAALEALQERELCRVELHNMRCITNNAMQFICNQRLKHLCIERCRNISEEGIAPFLSSKDLSVLQLKSFSILSHDFAGPHLPACRSLRTLDVSSSKLEFGLVASLAPSLVNLEHFDANYTNVRDDDILAIGTHCPRLTRLTLNGCEFISDACIGELSCALQHLNLSQTSITDEGIAILVRRCERLKYLFVGGCFELTDQTLQQTAMLELRELGFSYCPFITDYGVATLVSSVRLMESLEKLTLFQCGRVSVEAISTLVIKSTKLKHLGYSFGSADQVESLRHYSPVFDKDRHLPWRSRRIRFVARESIQSGDWMLSFAD